MINPLTCERCGGDLETDDAVSIIQGVCGWCRRGEPRPAGAVRRRAETTSARITPPRLDLSAAPELRPATHAAQFHGSQSAGVRVGEPTAAARSAREQIVFNPRSERRRRDLAIGMAVGFVVTAGVAGYFINRPASPTRETTPPVVTTMTATVSPPDATVILDAREIGPPDENGRVAFTLPVEGPDVHWLEVVADGYLDVRRPVSVAAGVRDIRIELYAKPVEIAIRTQPSQAEVWLAGEFKGYTPLSTHVSANLAGELIVRRSGYVDAMRTLEPSRGGRRIEFDITLDRAAPRLTVQSDPPGAEVLIHGLPRGTTPADIALDPSDWGKRLDVTLALAGFRSVTKPIPIPDDEAGPFGLSLTLAKAVVELRIRTEPPGGHVILDGRPMGRAPVTAELAMNRVGKTIQIDATVPGTLHGRREFTIPDQGDAFDVVVPLSSAGRRVVFAFANPDRPTGRDLLLHDEIIEQIHRLPPDREFALLSMTDTGLESWPGSTDCAASTAEQKVRAYDQVRSLRTTGSADLARLIEASYLFKPDVLWLFVPAGTDFESLRRIAMPETSRDVSVNIVTGDLPRAVDWVRDWTAARRGIVSVIGDDALREPTRLAGDPREPED